jgi:hypothetical protein
MTRLAAYRLTIFDANGTPWWGELDQYGDVAEACFSTQPSHPRPYLQLPESWTPPRVNFLQGSSDIGAVSVGVQDHPTDATDQNTGILTSRIKDAPGASALLERWDDYESAWVVGFRGKIQTYTIDEDKLVVYWLQLQDPRRFEEDDELFTNNETYVIYPKEGPVEDYGLMPSGEYLIPAADVATATFSRTSLAAPNPLWFVYYGWASFPVEPTTLLYNLAEAEGTPMDPLPGFLGVQWRYPRMTVRWRPAGGGPWKYLRDMPALGPSNAVTYPDQTLRVFGFPNAPTGLFLGGSSSIAPGLFGHSSTW